MTLLEFARGPGMIGALSILVAGLAWRVSGVLLLPYRRNLSTPRGHGRGLASAWGALATICKRMWPRRAFQQRVGVGLTLSYAFHIGLAIVLLGGAPHILLLEMSTGLGWSALPKGIVTLASGLTLLALVLLFLRRLVHPVLRLLSGFDDYASWLVTFLPVLSGVLLTQDIFGEYELLLALHILSVELLMIWLPFGKLAHVVFVFLGRGAQGAKFARKGAAS